MKHWIGFSFLVSLVTACGDDKKTSRPPQQVVQTVQIGQAKFPLLADGLCQFGVENLGGFDAYLWDGDDLQPNWVNLNDWSSATSLSSAFVTRTVFRYEELNLVGEQCQDRSRPSELTDPFCRERRSVQNSGELLKICQAPESYDRSSIEGAALTIAASLDGVHDFYQSLPESPSLETLMVLLFPNIEYQTTFNVTDDARISFSITDNAAWGRRGTRTEAENVFYVFPMSREYLNSRRGQANPNFWEVPWIIAHEFAHHIFYNLLGTKARRYFGYDFFHVHEHQEMPYHHVWQQFSNSASAKEDMQLTALNEASADLFAHYFRAEDSREIAQLDCVFQQRDVRSSRLNDDRKKSFVELMTKSSENMEPCRRVADNDVHVQGSIFAHFYDYMLNLSSLSLEFADDENWKAVAWLRFMQDFSVLIESALADGEQIEVWPMAVSSVVNTLNRSGAELNPAQCEWIDFVFGEEYSGSQQMTAYLDLSC